MRCARRLFNWPSSATWLQAAVLGASAVTGVSGCSEPAAGNKSVTLSWTAPSKNADGSPLATIAGYRVYVGRDSDKLALRGGVTGAASTFYVVRGLESGTYYFAVSAYTDVGAESPLSTVARKTL